MDNAAALSLLQQIFTTMNVTEATNGTAVPEVAKMLPPMVEALLPSSLSSIVNVLFSFSALRDWLKLFLIGGVFETCRRVAMSFYYYLLSRFYINAYFEEDDVSYLWIMFWLTRNSPIKKARNIEITTRTFGLDTSNSIYDSDDEDIAASERKISLIPSMSTSYSLWYKWHRVTVTRTERQKGYYGRTEETLVITILAWSQDVLLQLLQEARREYFAAQVNLISIYYADTSNNWRLACTRPKRPISSIVLDPGIKDLILDDARDFLSSKPWYTARGLPFRRGFLLYGAPGSGKTSVIHALAGELGLNVYVITLSRLGLDDTSLSELIAQLPEKCIALMEDIDAAFHHGLNREPDVVPPPGKKGETPSPQVKQNEAPMAGSRITLSGLLNALDGIGAQEGRILFATTNKYHSLDPALCRPGRMDVHVEFKLASKYQARELYRRFFLPDEPPSQEVGIVDAVSLEKTASDSGYNSSSSSVVDPSETASEKAPLLSSSRHPHKLRGADLTPDQLEQLADAFADAIPEREYSMASLQGYLMTYKIRPHQAVADAPAWVAKERLDREEKMRARMGVVVKQDNTEESS